MEQNMLRNDTAQFLLTPLFSTTSGLHNKNEEFVKNLRNCRERSLEINFERHVREFILFNSKILYYQINT